MSKLALLSVSDKSGLLPFATALVSEHGFKLLSTGGTAKMLREAGLPVTDVSEHTGFPEIMEGRVKTLHPFVHGGLLCRRDSEEHLAQAKKHGIALIDVVVVNLYPFETTVAKPDCAFHDAIENIDIGGPSMLRSAAKNHESVSVVTDPADYDRVLAAMKTGGETLSELRRELALKVFHRTAAYDAAIANYLENHVTPGPGDTLGLPRRLNISLPRAQSLRYGENPHQKAALYGNFHDNFTQLQGKELSYNNILDISSAALLTGEFERPTVAILKHNNPCGVGSSSGALIDAWNNAFATDRQAPFGGIIIANRTIDLETAEAIAEIFSEVIIAPEFEPAALAILAKKKNLRLMKAGVELRADSLREMRSVIGGVLVQDRDQKPVNPREFRVVTKRAPSPAEWEAMNFGWRVARHVKSNAIVYAAGDRTLGIGAGQMSRIDASRIAVWKAGEAKLGLAGSVVASDAFFPFPDGLLAAADAGATAAIQPGGSVKDTDVIAAADERGMAMVFTGTRHFRH